MPEATSTTRPSTSIDRLYSYAVPGWNLSGCLASRSMLPASVTDGAQNASQTPLLRYISPTGLRSMNPYTRPEVCVSRSSIVICRRAGTVPAASPLVGDSAGASTRICLNDGMKRDTGSEVRSLPSSTSIMIATLVTGFVIDAIRNIASSATPMRS
jgi:hypothetical protein